MQKGIELDRLKLIYLSSLNRGVEQLVARRAHNPKVAGSNPVPATKSSDKIRAFFIYTYCSLSIYIAYFLSEKDILCFNNHLLYNFLLFNLRIVKF